MKKLLYLIISGTLLMAACKGNDSKEKEEKTTASESAEKAETPSGMAEAADQLQSRAEELKKLSPVSTETLKALLPEELDGMKRTSYNVANTMGFSVGEAEYKVNDDSEIKVMVYDCVGEAGSAFYSMNYFMRLNMQQEDDNSYTKSVDFQGGKALEHFEKNTNDYQLTWLAADRFLVSVDGNNTGLDKVKSVAKSLDFSKAK